MHRLLKRQLKKIFGEKEIESEEVNQLVSLVNESYLHFQDDYHKLERILELSSKESFKELTNFKGAIDEAAIVTITDVKGEILFANENFVKISGYSLRELIGSNHNIVNSGYHPKSFWKEMWQTICKGETFKAEICNKNKNGDIYWVNSTIIPFMLENGKPFQFISIRFDITARKKIEEEIKTLALVAQKTQNAVIISDSEGKAIWANEGFTAITEFTVEEIVGLKPGELLQGPKTNPETRKQISNALKEKKPCNTEILNYTKSGNEYWISINITPLFEEDKHIGFIAIEADITERKLVEQQLIENEKILQALNNASSELLVNSNFNQAINKAISMMGTALKVDKIQVYENSSKSILNEKFFWDRLNDNFEFDRAEKQNLDFLKSGYEDWLSTLEKGTIIRDSIKDPDSQKLSSLVLSPIHIQGNFWGFISFIYENPDKHWSKSEDQYLLNFSNTIGAAIERYYSENKLKENEEKFRLLIESATDIFYYTDEEGKFTYVNEISSKITGYTNEELLSMKYLDLVEPSYRKEVKNFYTIQTFKGQRVTYNEFPIMTKSGKIAWVGQNVQLIIHNGKVEGIQAIARDITNLKTAQLEVEVSRNFLNEIIDSIPNPLFVKNRQHQWVLVNQAYCNLTGINKENILGKTEFEFLQSADAAHYTKLDEEQFVSGSETVRESSEIDPEGQLKNLLIKKNIFTSKSSPFLIAIITDITEIKKRESEILLYNKITDQISDAISVADQSGRLIYVNQSHANALGKSKEELIGMHISKMEKIFENPQVWTEHFEDVKKKGALIIEGANIKKDGTSFPVEASVNWLNLDGNEVIVAAIRDITERKKIEKEIRDKSQILKAITDNLPVVLYRINKEGFFTESIGKGLSRIEVSENELNGRNFREVYPKQEFPVINEQLEEALLTRKANNYVTSGNSSEGVWSFDNFVFADETDPDCIIGFALDITERKKAENLVLQSEKRFRSLVQNATDITTVLSANGEVMYESPSFYRIFGYEENDVKNKSIFELIHPEDVQHALAEFQKGLEKGGVSSSVQFRMRHKDGHFIPVESIGNNLLHEPEVNGIVVNSRDITERLKAEEESNRLKLFYENILNKIPSDVVVFNHKHEYLFVNEMAIRDEEKRKWLIGKDDYDYCQKYGVAKTIADARRKMFNSVIESKVQLELEEKLLRPDGNARWMLRRMYPVLDDNNQVTFMIGFGIDITERKLAEEIVKESEERLSLAINSANLGIWDWKIEENKLIWDASMYKLFEVNPSDFSGDYDAFDKTLHPDDRQRVNEEVAQSLYSEGSFESIFRIIDKNGKVKYITAYSKIFRKEDKTPYRMIGVNFDITESKLAEQRILKQQHDLEEAQHIARVGGWEIQVDTQTISWTKEMFHICEKSNDYQPTLNDTYNLFTNDTREKIRESFVKAIETYEPFEHEAKIRIGKRKFLDIRVKGLPLNENGKVSTIKGIFQDISAEKESKRQLELYNEELEKKNKELDQFAYVVSHDLKAPLRGINNLSMWIEEDLEGKMEEDTKNNLDLMRKRVKRMEGLIDGILQYSRAGRIKHEASAFNLNDALDDLVESLSPPEKFKITIAQDLPNMVTEKIAIEQIFANYISNAIKYNNNPEPTIDVSWKQNGDFYEFCVADNGPGIEKEFHEKVFVIFQTLQARDTFESTGVGLAIVKKIVEDKGGKVWIESEKGEGTKFFFSWPAIGDNIEEAI
ncbi:MAG: PAS domain S-box protein [Bacteroidia bacterium]